MIENWKQKLQTDWFSQKQNVCEDYGDVHAENKYAIS